MTRRLQKPLAISEDLRQLLESQDNNLGTGWPAHSFFSQPIYRRISMGKDVRITNLGVTLREMKAGRYRYTYLSWDKLFKMRKTK